MYERVLPPASIIRVCCPDASTSVGHTTGKAALVLALGAPLVDVGTAPSIALGPALTIGIDELAELSAMDGAAETDVTEAVPGCSDGEALGVLEPAAEL